MTTSRLAARRRRLAVAGLVAAVLGITAACGGDEPDPTDGTSGAPTSSSDDGSEAPVEEVSIEFQLRAEPEEAAVYASVVEAYEQDNPGVTVEMVPLSGDDHTTRLTTSFASGNPPDVFLLNYREFAPFVQRGAIEPIGPLLDLDLDLYYPAPVDAFDIGGALQCFPQNVSSLVVYYNRTMFEAAGIEMPITSWTFDEFADAARALTTDTVHGIGIDPRLRRIAPFVWSNGGQLVDDTDAPTAMALQEPAAQEALQMLVDLQAEGVSPTREDVASANFDEQFINGTLAMFLSSRVDTPQFREQTQLDFDVAPMPVIDEPVSVLHTDAYCLAAGIGDAEAQAAVDFIQYATGQQGQALAALGGRTVPSLISVAESPAFLDPTVRPASSQVFLDAIPLLQQTPVLTTWPEVEDVTDGLLAEAFYDGRPLAEVLAEINELASPLLVSGAPTG